jgi:hypothetical protein
MARHKFLDDRLKTLNTLVPADESLQPFQKRGKFSIHSKFGASLQRQKKLRRQFQYPSEKDSTIVSDAFESTQRPGELSYEFSRLIKKRQNPSIVSDPDDEDLLTFKGPGGDKSNTNEHQRRI